MESPLTVLPRELTTEVLGRVASSSIADLYNAKLCCKELFGAAEEEYVHKQITLDKIPIIQWSEDRKISDFLNKCRQSRNPEALFRKGVVDYFGGKDVSDAIRCLQEASKSGHSEASYTMAVIWLFEGGESSKQKGLKMLSGMQKSRIQKRRIKNCRERLESIVVNILVDNASILKQQPTCCVMGHQRKKRRFYWGEEIDEDDNIACDACTCDEELTAIRKAIRWTTTAYAAEN
ncbi:OLC1v1026967C1 [Oldenlandia corymbosa var. corymbosa]|uniref:OLC1v1026967C1 n=1 Tax=Oldenlandia corymbosa var. corymbosa TaxID=529605 RepID=A0AAV1C8T7_OLDCO|nr:OLC1v1026967C1 [Oldenlandia corymbosa var. corymbosa]